MDELYRARLSASPHPHASGHHHDPTPPDNDSHTIHIHHSNPPPQPVPAPAPIQLPNIYVQAYPVPPAPRPTPTPAAPVPESEPKPDPPADESPAAEDAKLGPIKFRRPHPLLWLSLVLSLLALILEVPKGSLPTLTGRHKALRTQEKLLAEKLQILTQLSTFLPPPLSALVAPHDPAHPVPSPLLALSSPAQLDLFRQGLGLRFWNAHKGAYGAAGDGGSWWSIEELGRGASVVRSKGEGGDREVWVLKMGDGIGENDNAPLMNALTHSLLLRDRLQSELNTLKTTPCPVCPADAPRLLHQHHSRDKEQDEEELRELQREEWDRLEERKRREREREREKGVEEREREVRRREKWVVEEMRKLSDKVHSQATELTLEDRITERLKAYQRQLTQLHEAAEL